MTMFNNSVTCPVCSTSSAPTRDIVNGAEVLCSTCQTRLIWVRCPTCSTPWYLREAWREYRCGQCKSEHKSPRPGTVEDVAAGAAKLIGGGTFVAMLWGGALEVTWFDFVPAVFHVLEKNFGEILFASAVNAAIAAGISAAIARLIGRRLNRELG